MPYQFRQTGAEIQDILDQVGENTQDIAQNASDIDALNSNLTNKFTNGTWTPTVMRANIAAAYGKWFKIGDVYFLSGDITFSSNQTAQGNIYIAEDNFPMNDGAYAIYGSGGASFQYVLGCTSINKNVWVAQVGIGRIQATQSGLAGDTVRFELIAIPM